MAGLPPLATYHSRFRGRDSRSTPVAIRRHDLPCGSSGDAAGYARGVSSDVMPAYVGVLLAHACLQVLADDHGVDLLHIKGPAVDESLLNRRTESDSEGQDQVDRFVPRHSVDADVLVRPSHVNKLFKALSQHGWRMAYDFADGSAFEHASTWEHRALEHVDVHRQFPGIGLDGERAFDALWAERHQTTLAGQQCPVPDVTAQRLILILHAVRGGHLLDPDITNSWTRASDEQRVAVETLAARLQAQVALGAATGRLEDHRDSREYDLWKVLSTGNSSLSRLWFARVKAQPGVAAKIRMGIKLVVPNRNRMAQRLGHRPTSGQMAHEYLQQAKTAAGELGRLVRSAPPRRPRQGERP